MKKYVEMAITSQSNILTLALKSTLFNNTSKYVDSLTVETDRATNRK